MFYDGLKIQVRTQISIDPSELRLGRRMIRIVVLTLREGRAGGTRDAYRRRPRLERCLWIHRRSKGDARWTRVYSGDQLRLPCALKGEELSTGHDRIMRVKVSRGRSSRCCGLRATGGSWSSLAFVIDYCAL